MRKNWGVKGHWRRRPFSSLSCICLQALLQTLFTLNPGVRSLEVPTAISIFLVRIVTLQPDGSPSGPFPSSITTRLNTRCAAYTKALPVPNAMQSQYFRTPAPTAPIVTRTSIAARWELIAKAATLSKAGTLSCNESGNTIIASP